MLVSTMLFCNVVDVNCVDIILGAASLCCIMSMVTYFQTDPGSCQVAPVICAAVIGF